MRIELNIDLKNYDVSTLIGLHQQGVISDKELLSQAHSFFTDIIYDYLKQASENIPSDTVAV